MKKKFNLGFLYGDFDKIDVPFTKKINSLKENCDKIILGIFSDELEWRIKGAKPNYSFEEKKQLFENFNLIEGVFFIDENSIGLINCYSHLHFDVCFYGSEYGQQFEKDKIYLENHGVKFISLVPNFVQNKTKFDPLAIALNNCADKKIILWGTGKYFELFLQRYRDICSIGYAVDSNSDKHGKTKNGITIRGIEYLHHEKADDCLIIICCKDYRPIVSQLLSIGKFDYRTMIYDCSIALYEEQFIFIQEEQNYLSKSHTLLMKLMQELDSACTKLNLKYYVISGSLIGVVRHGDMIPWDDDIDVAMTRHDYEILRASAKEIWNEDSDFTFVDYDQLGKDAFLDFMTRLVYLKGNISSGIFNKAGTKVDEKLLNRMVLDIYVLDEASNNDVRHKLYTNIIKLLYVFGMGHRSYVDYSEYDRVSAGARLVIRLVNIVGKLLPLSLIFYLFDKVRSYARNEGSDFYFESNGVINYMPYKYNKELYGDGKRMKMNVLDVMVPSDTDGLLKAKGYGNYMQFPSPDNRIPHHSSKHTSVIW